VISLPFLSDKLLIIDSKKVANKAALMIRRYVESENISGVIVGMGGGLDSSVTAVLAVRALSNDRVVGLSLPEAETLSLQDVKDAKKLAEHLGITFYSVDISEPLKALHSTIPVFNSSDRITNGNLKARIRMTTLYYFANKLRLIVLGTNNKSEILMGYFTKYGDGASDLAPLADLYKTQVYQLASYLGLPDRIISKEPTAGLWPGQLDEAELGVKYKVLDLILYGFECGMPNGVIANQLRVPVKTVDRIHNSCLKSEHKRSRLVVVKTEA